MTSECAADFGKGKEKLIFRSFTSEINIVSIKYGFCVFNTCYYVFGAYGLNIL